MGRKGPSGPTQPLHTNLCNCEVCPYDTSDMKGALADCKAKIFSDREDQQLRGCSAVRCLLSRELNPPIDECIDAGLLPRLVQFLRSKNPRLQFEAAWAITNVASGASSHTALVVSHGAVPEFVNLLRGSDLNACEQAAWALGNVAGDSILHRDLVIDTDALTLLCKLAGEPTAPVSMLRNCTWSLANLCRGRPQPAFTKVKPVVPVFAKFIQMKDQEVLIDACWGLSYLSDGSHEQIDAVIASGCLPRLAELLRSSSAEVVTPVIRTVGNLVTGSDVHTQQVVEAGVLGPLRDIVSDTKCPLPHRKEAIWTISNIAAGSQLQVEATIVSGAFKAVATLLAEGCPYMLQKEGVWVLSNATNRDRLTSRMLISQGILDGLLALLRSAPPPRIASIALDGLHNIISCGCPSWRQLREDDIRLGYQAARIEPPPQIPSEPDELWGDCKDVEPFVRQDDSFPLMGRDSAAVEKPLHMNPHAVMVELMGGVDLLEGLQFYPDDEVVLKSRMLLSNFWHLTEVSTVESASKPLRAKKLVPSDQPDEEDDDDDDRDGGPRTKGPLSARRGYSGGGATGSGGSGPKREAAGGALDDRTAGADATTPAGATGAAGAGAGAGAGSGQAEAASDVGRSTAKPGKRGKGRKKGRRGKKSAVRRR